MKDIFKNKKVIAAFLGLISAVVAALSAGCVVNMFPDSANASLMEIK